MMRADDFLTEKKHKRKKRRAKPRSQYYYGYPIGWGLPAPAGMESDAGDGGDGGSE